MSSSLEMAFRTAESGLRAQSLRARVLSENIANADTTASAAGGDPYRRKTVTFASEVDRATGALILRSPRVGEDERAFPVEHRPGHPAADENGNVKLPNVDMIVELADLKEASRAYQASLQLYRQTRELHAMTIDLLKA